MTSPTSGSYTPGPATGGCRTGKLQFATRKQAKARARTMRGSGLNAYRCEHCDWFHLGHKPQRVRNGEIDKAAWLHGGPIPTPRPPSPADLARLTRKPTA